MSDPSEQIGPPSLSLELLQVWVHGRQYPNSQDRWDGNWLNVVVHCGKDGASVSATGAILDAAGVARFRDGLAQIYRTLAGEAVLESYEPHLKVHVEASDASGHLQVRVEITPDPASQGHWFEFMVDQTHLPPLIDQLASVLDAYPVRG